MDRRNFITITGTALGTLLINDSFAKFNAGQKIALPQQIMVTLSNGIHKLSTKDDINWIHEDVLVKLKYDNSNLAVELNCPSTAISNIIISWSFNDKAAKYLGDHWERTYGDVSFQKADFERKMPWYFIQHDDNDTNCFGVKTGCKSICHWQVGKGKMQLVLDTKNGGNGVVLGDRTLQAATIVTTKNKAKENTFTTASRFCKMMCDQPLNPKMPVYGINDWYITYGINSAEIILNHTARMAELVADTNNRPFSVIDSGWAAYSPHHPGDCCWQDDFAVPNKNFKDMAKVADEIKELGMRPGLWTRPLCASHKDREHILLPNIPGRTSKTKRVLDPSIEENLARVRFNIKTYREWGYELVKHDFTTYDMFGKWGMNMQDDITTVGWNFYDKSKTNAELILNLYQNIRSVAGEMYLLGCNTISHLSAGLFEINRIGDDTSSKEWARTRKMGVNTLAFRGIHHQNFYAADADCVGLSKSISWQNNKQWMQLLAESGTPLFISAPEEATGTDQKNFIKQCFAKAAKKLPIGEPLDWLNSNTPTKWKLDGKIINFNWDEVK
ncbi:MAG: hypothetical protein EOO42_04265 [Flavobacteriales bacterium]|nr:MAG: hypothetical protein EOO42_04265 [Flavobacteriales bacterium]